MSNNILPDITAIVDRLRPKSEARIAEIKKEAEIQQARDITAKIAASGIPLDYRESTFEQLEGVGKHIIDPCRSWAVDLPGWVFVTGPVGTGKTHMMCSAISEAIRNGHDAAFISASMFLLTMRERWAGSEQLYKRATDVKVLGLDDLASHKMTEYAVEIFSGVIDAREAAGRPTFITSNATLGELDKMGVDVKRIADRIRGKSKDRRFKLVGRSRR